MDKPNEEQNGQKNTEEQENVQAQASAEVEAPKEEAKEAPQQKQEEVPAEAVAADNQASKAEESKPAEKPAEVKTEAGADKSRGDSRGKRGKPFGRRPQRDEQVASDFMEKVISINRITKVTKGGKKLSFSALVVVGDMKGKVGYSLSKASEVATAIRKAMGNAKKQMVQVPMRGATITHEIIGECGGAEVLLKPASEGTGVIAAGPVRAVCDGAGIHNILTKCHRSNNPINVVKATIDGLSRLKSSKL